MFFGSFDWAADQSVFNCERENFATFEKNEPWQIKRCWSLSSCPEWKSLRTSFVELYMSYWILVWLLVDFQRSFMESFGDVFNNNNNNNNNN
jgi:hypothetical protein